MPTNLPIGELAAMATAVLWTLSTLAWTSAGRSIGALAVSFIRLPIACGLLVAYSAIVMGYGYFVHGSSPRMEVGSQSWLPLTISGFAGFFLADLCLFKSFLLIGPRLALLIQALMPPMATVMSWAAYGQGLAGWQWLAMGVTLAGVAWVVLEQPQHDGRPAPPRHLARGVMLAVVSAAAQALGAVLGKQGMSGCDPVSATLIRILGALGGYVVLVTLWRRWPSVLAATRQGRAMVIIVFGALVGPAAGVVLYMIALDHCSPGVVTTIISTMPVLILPFVIFLYREKVSPRAAGGAVLSVLGVALLVYWSRS